MKGKRHPVTVYEVSKPSAAKQRSVTRARRARVAMEGFPDSDDTAQPTAVAKGRHDALQQTPLIGASFMMTQVPGRPAHACALQPLATQ